VNRRRLVAIARKEWIQIIREPRTLAIVFALPVVLLLLYGYGMNLDLKKVRMGLVDRDNSPSSRDLVAALTQTGYFRIERLLSEPAEAEEVFYHRWCSAVIVIPRGFHRDLSARRTAQVQILLDGTDPTTTGVAQGYFEGVIRASNARLRREAALRAGLPESLTTPPFEVRTWVLYNPSLSSTQYIVPGLIALILSILAALLTSSTVVRERERGTFEALAASPVRPAEIMLGKLIPYVGIAAGDVILALLTGAVLFHVIPKGSLVLLFLLSTLFVLAVLGVGLMFSSITRTQQVASLLTFTTTVLPTFLLSGFVFPVRNMPFVLQCVSKLIPTSHYLIIIRGIVLKGVGIAELWPQTLALAAYAAVVVAIAARAFRKSL